METTMSCNVRIRDAKFRIRAENQRAALVAAHALPDVTYVCFDRDSRESREICVTFEAWSYEPIIDECDYATGDIIGLARFDDCFGEDEKLFFEAIAPYVEAGSYIEYAGRDGDMWRWSFDGKKLVTLRPRIEWVAEGAK